MSEKSDKPKEFDLLFEVRTNYWLGHYQAAINASLALNTKTRNNEITLERDIYVYCSHLEQGNYKIVLEEINFTSSAKPLQVIRVLAEYLCGEKHISGIEANQELVTRVEHILTATSSSTSTPSKEINWIHYLVAVFYYRLFVFERALRHLLIVLQNDDSFLEARVLVVELYLRLHRIDLAEKEFKVLQSKYDYAIPTLLAACWLNLAHGGDKAQEALYTYQELIEKYGASVTLLVNLAVAQMHLKNFTAAEKTLLEALEKVWDPHLSIIGG
jgi:tetratricopeptide (TPR) repeat protein